MGHERGSSVNERHYLSDPTPVEMSPFLEELTMTLSQVAAFQATHGIDAIQDALRRKNEGRGSAESIGAAAPRDV